MPAKSLKRPRKQPEPRRKARRSPGFASRTFDAAGRIIARHPSLAAGGVVFAVVFSFVTANAIWYQPGGHPSPLMSTRTGIAPGPAPLMTADEVQPRQIEQAGRDNGASETATASDDGVDTIEDILTPVPSRRVQSIVIERPEDRDMATASIPPEAATTVDDIVRPAASQATTDRALIGEIQAELSRLGHYDGAVDGLTGPQTRAALAAFGAASGSEGLGLTASTLQRLKAAQRAAPPVAQPQARSETRPDARPEARPETATVQRASVSPNESVALTPPAGLGARDSGDYYTPPAEIPAAGGSASGDMETVRRIQQGLVNIAYADVAVDGMLGSQTRQAIREFQGDYRLPTTGQPDQAVLDKLREIGAF
ncbi:peptidoglycan-binding domain-containing protein [Rhizobium sp. EC-SD404]|uniref:peptidoglycan-binding domain-containing protein n=1 Tax=Rhizobium sp. EC-SD404 TaxID=2038389 RepID=UPI00125873DB|nr:peptidoglycan-binding domain-containing protein [Rhizobium sp. EC-SD404]VVT14012.1 putative Peptidoglycan-binding protein [Rhizobium sp. EC-SD404]